MNPALQQFLRIQFNIDNDRLADSTEQELSETWSGAGSRPMGYLDVSYRNTRDSVGSMLFLSLQLIELLRTYTETRLRTAKLFL